MSEHASKLLLSSINVHRSEHDSVESVEVNLIAQHSTPGRDGTVLRREISFTKKAHGKWKVIIDLDDIPHKSTLGETSEKLSEWLIRIGQTLAENSLDSIDLSQF